MLGVDELGLWLHHETAESLARILLAMLSAAEERDTASVSLRLPAGTQVTVAIFDDRSAQVTVEPANGPIYQGIADSTKGLARELKEAVAKVGGEGA